MKKTPKHPRRQRPVEPPDDDDDDDGDELLEQGAAEAQDLDAVTRQLAQELGEDSSQARTHVHRVVQNGDSQRCFSCPSLQFSSESIREQWGPGTYSIMTYVRGKLAHRDRIVFAEPLKPAATATVAAPADASAGMRELMARLEQRMDRDQAQQFELLKLMAGTRTQADPLQIQQSTLAMLASVRELTGGGAAQASDRSSIDAFLEGIKIAQRLKGGGEGEGGTDWGGIALGVVEGMKAIAANNTPSPSRLPAAAVALSPPPPGDTAPAIDSTEDADMMGKLRQALQFLVKKAAAGADPTLYADVALDNIGELPELVQPIAIDYIRRADCLERLGAIEPDVLKHRQWFDSCVAEMRRTLSRQDASPSLTEEGAPPDPDA